MIPSRKSRLLRWLLQAAGLLCLGALLAWGCLAIYHSNLPWRGLRIALAAGFFVYGLRMMRPPASRRRFAGFAAAYAGLLVWWAMIPPSHDRDWKPDVAVLPQAMVDGDRVTISNCRSFSYAPDGSPVVRYEDREFRLADVTSLDFFISYWGGDLVGHTFLSFQIRDAPPLCISIEARQENGESFGPIPALFKQFELIYIAGDERDIVGSRTGHRGERVYRYPLRISPEATRRLLAVYLERMRKLEAEPEFYHLLSNNCTINIARAAGRSGGFDRRYLVNGLIDRYLYEAGLIDTALPFDELRRRSRIVAGGE